MRSLKAVSALGLGLVLAIAGIVWVRNSVIGAVQTFVPGPLTRDPVVSQARRGALAGSDESLDAGWLYVDGGLGQLKSVHVGGATLRMVLVAPESSFFVGGRPDRHIVQVSIARERPYIEGFTVSLNGRVHTLTRAPSTWLGTLLGAGERDDGPVGRRKWSNRWFPVAEMAPLGHASLGPRLPAGTVPLAKGDRYEVREHPFPYTMHEREVVVWRADDPESVVATSMDRTEPAGQSN